MIVRNDPTTNDAAVAADADAARLLLDQQAVLAAADKILTGNSILGQAGTLPDKKGLITSDPANTIFAVWFCPDKGVILSGILDLRGVRIGPGPGMGGETGWFSIYSQLSNFTGLLMPDAVEPGIENVDCANLDGFAHFPLAPFVDVRVAVLTGAFTTVSLPAGAPIRNITISACLTQDQVDAVLAWCVAGGQENGICELSGVSMSPPSAAGLADKETLEATGEPGWTVTVSS